MRGQFYATRYNEEEFQRFPKASIKLLSFQFFNSLRVISCNTYFVRQIGVRRYLYILRVDLITNQEQACFLHLRMMQVSLGKSTKPNLLLSVA